MEGGGGGRGECGGMDYPGELDSFENVMSNSSPLSSCFVSKTLRAGFRFELIFLKNFPLRYLKFHPFFSGLTKS